MTFYLRSLDLTPVFEAMERLPRSWQDFGKISVVCHGPCQGYHVKNSIEPLSVFDRVLVEI